jgi:FkbM family methyltransferase
VSLITAARSHSRTAVNAVAKLFGVRVVNARWGPRGFRASLEKTRAQGFRPATIIDVGASNGQWTRECLQIFPDARYLLVDPLEENRPTLERLAGSAGRVEVWHGALGAAPGQLQLWAHGDQSSLLRSSDFPGQRRPVELRTLDSFIATNRLLSPMLLKADVQGYELEVLKGAERCLEMCEVLLIEVSFRRLYDDSPLAHDIVAYLADRRFRVYDICSFVQRPADNELVQCDIVFAREGCKLFAYEGWGRAP